LLPQLFFIDKDKVKQGSQQAVLDRNRTKKAFIMSLEMDYETIFSVMDSWEILRR
jgi:hypothetical protein